MKLNKGLKLTEPKEEIWNEGSPPDLGGGQTLSGMTNHFLTMSGSPIINEIINEAEENSALSGDPYQRAINIIKMYTSGIKR